MLKRSLFGATLVLVVGMGQSLARSAAPTGAEDAAKATADARPSDPYWLSTDLTKLVEWLPSERWRPSRDGKSGHADDDGTVQGRTR